MNCQEFRKEFAEGGDQASLLAHPGECASCAALLAGHLRLRQGLRLLAAEERHAGAPARVELGLLAAFRSQHRLARRVQARQWWIPALSWALAACVLMAAALFLLRPHQPPPAHRGAAVEVASIAEAPDPYQAEEDDGFIAIPNARGLDPSEEVNVVRVEVPRSAMLEVGLAVSADRVSELVEADVMLGPDGLARAIRFLDEPAM